MFSLARDNAVIIERPARGGTWQLAEVVAFIESIGAHTVRYASSAVPGHETLRFGHSESDVEKCLDLVSFDAMKESTLMLSTRHFVIVHRRRSFGLSQGVKLSDSSMEVEPESVGVSDVGHNELQEAVGSRVAWSNDDAMSWRPGTLISVDSSGMSTIVTDDDTVVQSVPHSRVRPNRPATNQSASIEFDPSMAPWARDQALSLGTYPFVPVNRRRLDRSQDSSSISSHASGKLVMKRTWSALSLADSKRPVDLLFHQSPSFGSATDQNQLTFNVRIGDADVLIICASDIIENPCSAVVKYSMQEHFPGSSTALSKDMTVIGAVRHLQLLNDKKCPWNAESPVQLFFYVDTHHRSSSPNLEGCASIDSHLELEADPMFVDQPREASREDSMGATRARKLSSRSLSGCDEEDENRNALCEGFSELCVQCMEAINVLSEFSPANTVQSDRDIPVESLFANATLSKKLSDQLDDALVVAGKAIPAWCTVGPSFAPRSFSYECRRLLLERFAFGVSRSILKQQEAKIDVGRLRQRMASLRARAVELVSEAFSGGAEDPTALQLQADELYGMEEALAARVRAAFRAVKWQEHVLQVAKAVVRREHLLSDATAIMNRFTESDVRHRRLEVRFDGESGFDAASGNEAGVTRGFYADIAESLLSAEHVAGVFCSSTCSLAPVAASLKPIPMELELVQDESSKLPLWISDFDTSGQVVIPTPRADERSAPGVFPRPLPSYHPQLPEVLDRFRFMGRLFAAALRDGFMFPLPLCSSFLKLVLRGNEKSPVFKAAVAETPNLTSADLPRPGFLGGEVYAAETYVCKALDAVDAIDPPLSGLELERRYKEIASDRKFAREALGKLFDCSFEDYFVDRTFVDPLDPSQGEDAVPLCPKGHKKHVTIYNVREWVALSKHFILHEGVMAQATSFRRGVDDFFSADYLRLFTPEELQRDVCGIGDNVDNWDEAAVRKVFKLDGTYEC